MSILSNDVSFTVDSINFSQTFFEFADGDAGLVSFLDLRGFLLDLALYLISVISARVGRVILVELPVEVVLEFDDKVLQNPHVTLVNESIDSNKHVGMDRASHNLHLRVVATVLRKEVRRGCAQAHLLHGFILA